MNFSCNTNTNGVRRTGSQRGYYYSIVFNGTLKKAQYSSVYFSDCTAGVLDEKTKEYGTKQGFGEFRVVGSFSTTQEAEDDKTESKKQFKNTGYVIGGDNNFFGDCNP